MIRKPLEYISVSRQTGKKTVKKSYPYRIGCKLYIFKNKSVIFFHIKPIISHELYDFFCPNCDLYFRNYDDYQTHLLYQVFSEK